MKLYKKGLNKKQILERLDQVASPENTRGEYNMDADTVSLVSDYVKKSDNQKEALMELIKKYKKHKRIIDAVIMLYSDKGESIEDLMAESLSKE